MTPKIYLNVTGGLRTNGQKFLFSLSQKDSYPICSLWHKSGFRQIICITFSLCTFCYYSFSHSSLLICLDVALNEQPASNIFLLPVPAYPSCGGVSRTVKFVEFLMILQAVTIPKHRACVLKVRYLNWSYKMLKFYQL